MSVYSPRSAQAALRARDRNNLELRNGESPSLFDDIGDRDQLLASGGRQQESAARAYAFYAFILGQSLLVDAKSAAKASEVSEFCARLLIGEPRR
jgi:hypothetical protein